MSAIEIRIKEMNLILPAPPKAYPLAEYVMSRQKDNMLYLSGIGPVDGVMPVITGRLVWTVRRTENRIKHEEGYKAARLAALNVLSAAKEALGDLDRIESIVKITGYVACDEDFYDHNTIINGASHIFNDVFKDKGIHCVTAVGVCTLPMNMPVVLDVVMKIRTE